MSEMTCAVPPCLGMATASSRAVLVLSCTMLVCPVPSEIPSVAIAGKLPLLQRHPSWPSADAVAVRDAVAVHHAQCLELAYRLHNCSLKIYSALSYVTSDVD